MRKQAAALAFIFLTAPAFAAGKPPPKKKAPIEHDVKKAVNTIEKDANEALDAVDKGVHKAYKAVTEAGSKK